jgi:hypothetical protein
MHLLETIVGLSFCARCIAFLCKIGIIPHLWYIECHNIGIVGVQKSPYLCTQIINI